MLYNYPSLAKELRKIYKKQHCWNKLVEKSNNHWTGLGGSIVISDWYIKDIKMLFNEAGFELWSAFIQEHGRWPSNFIIPIVIAVDKRYNRSRLKVYSLS